MTRRTTDSEPKENSLPIWMMSLRVQGVSKDVLLKTYAEGVAKANYDLETRGVKKIIDVGAGTGLVARGLRSGFRHINGLDPSEAMLSVARKDNLYENYFCEFITDKQLPIEPDTYDGLTATACFSPNHMRPDASTEMIRIVKPGGVIVLVARSSVFTTSSEFKDWTLTSIDTLEKERRWKKLVAGATGYYHQGETAIVWKFQDLEKSKN